MSTASPSVPQSDRDPGLHSWAAHGRRLLSLLRLWAHPIALGFRLPACLDYDIDAEMKPPAPKVDTPATNSKPSATAMTEPEQAWVAYSGVTAASLVSMVQNLFHSISDAAATNARLSKGTSSGREPEALRRCLVSAAPSVSAHDQRPEPELAAAESAAAHSRSPWLVTVDVEEVRELTVTLLSGALSQSLAQSVARAGAQSSVTSAVTAAAVTADAAVAVPAAVQALSTMLMVTASAATVTTTNEAPLTQSGAVPAAVERFLSVIKSSCDRALATAAVSDTNAVAANAVAEALAAANGLATGAGAKTVSTSSAIGNRWGEECAWTALAAIHNNSNNKNSRKNLSSTDFNIASGASLTTGAAAAAAALATALTSQSSAARESGLDCAWEIGRAHV